MTATASSAPAAALSGQHRDLPTPGLVSRASYGVAAGLVATLLALGLLAGSSSPARRTQPVAVTPLGVTDPPAPAYVLRLERDPFR